MINKWALGISDTYALGVLAETTGLDVPIVVLPFVNSTLVGREPFRRSAEGVRILPGPGGFQPRKAQSPHLSGAGRGTAQTPLPLSFWSCVPFREIRFRDLDGVGDFLGVPDPAFGRGSS